MANYEQLMNLEKKQKKQPLPSSVPPVPSSHSSSSLSERTNVWGRAVLVSPISAIRWGKGQASYANYAAQVGEKTAVCLLSDRLLAGSMDEGISVWKSEC